MYSLGLRVGASVVLGGTLSLAQATSGLGIAAIRHFLGIGAEVVQAAAHEEPPTAGRIVSPGNAPLSAQAGAATP
jgi:hypothetical protein